MSNISLDLDAGIRGRALANTGPVQAGPRDSHFTRLARVCLRVCLAHRWLMGLLWTPLIPPRRARRLEDVRKCSSTRWVRRKMPMAYCTSRLLEEDRPLSFASMLYISLVCGGSMLKNVCLKETRTRRSLVSQNVSCGGGSTTSSCQSTGHTWQSEAMCAAHEQTNAVGALQVKGLRLVCHCEAALPCRRFGNGVQVAVLGSPRLDAQLALERAGHEERRGLGRRSARFRLAWCRPADGCRNLLRCREGVCDCQTLALPGRWSVVMRRYPDIPRWQAGSQGAVGTTVGVARSGTAEDGRRSSRRFLELLRAAYLGNSFGTFSVGVRVGTGLHFPRQPALYPRLAIGA